MPGSYQLPGGLSPDEERAVLAALERYFQRERPLTAAWSMAGRLEATGQGAHQARGLMRSAWTSATRAAFARLGSMPMHGRADAR